MNEYRFGTPDDLADNLARRVADDLRMAIVERGTASLVVSGGSTPKPFFARLSERELDWSRVQITLADERWVEPSDAASNERLVREMLLVGAASRASFIGLKTSHATPEEGCVACEDALRAMPRPFDVVVFGMGSDGHTASLFPDAAGLEIGLDPDNPALCLPIHPPAASHPRMSLTMSALVSGRRLILHITGDAKWHVYQQALQDGPDTEFPIRAVLRQAGDRLDVYWAS